MATPDTPKKEKSRAGKAAKDDLTKISGVGPALEAKLNAAGITTYVQIAGLKKADAVVLDEQIGARGRIVRDNWVKQAKALLK